MIFLTQLDALIESKHLLKHPFYIAWGVGKLSKECLQTYAKEYYAHVKAFPTYLSTLHSHTEDAHTRKSLLKNLIEEEDGSPNHPELWKEFGVGLGVSSHEMDEATTCEEISTLISTFKQNCADENIAVGLASLYAYESQIPPICLSKIDGLKKYYGITNPKTYEYFRVHIAADTEHARDERELLQKHLTHEEDVLSAANTILDNLNNFLTSLTKRFVVD